MLELRPKPGSPDILRLDESFIWWKGDKVAMEEISAIAYMFVGSNQNLVSSHGAYIDLHTTNKVIHISTKNYGFSGHGEAEDNMREIVNVVLLHVGQRIFARVVKQIFEDRMRVTIGSLCIACDGISHRSFLGRETFVPWSWYPSASYGSKMEWGWLTFRWSEITGPICVVYSQPGSGKIETLCKVPPSEENGFLVGPLLRHATPDWVNRIGDELRSQVDQAIRARSALSGT